MNSAIEEIHTLNQMETPKSTLGIFELPCGHLDVETQELAIEVQVREITGHEEDMLASKQIPSSQKITNLLSGCVIRLGAVEDSGQLNRMVRELPLGDRVFLVFAIRRVTLGDDLPVREKCPSCGLTTLFMVDLAEELQPKPMPDRMKRVFDAELPSGKQIRFRVSVGSDEVRMAKLQQRKQAADALSHAILMRLELLEGEKPTMKMVKSLGMRDRLFIREEFQRVEGGVDTTLELECPSCRHEWEKDLDLGASSFFFPGAPQKP
jgi:hypothetical protein